MAQINLRFVTVRKSAMHSFSVGLDSGFVVTDAGVPAGDVDFFALPLASQAVLAKRGWNEIFTDSLARCTTGDECRAAISRTTRALLSGTWGEKTRATKETATEGARVNPRIKIMLALPGPNGESSYEAALRAVHVKKYGAQPKVVDKEARKEWEIQWRDLCATVLAKPATSARIDAEIKRLEEIAAENARRAKELLEEIGGDATDDLLAGF